MNKKGLLKTFIILIILIIIGVYYGVQWIAGAIYDPQEGQENLECETDADCVPKDCCHASACVPASQAPVCDGIFCTAECVPGTLDCGQASCACQNNKCTTT